MDYKFILEDNSTLEDAIKVMDSIGKGTLVVVDKNDLLIGMITDGDIRRSILNKSLNLNSIINKNPTTMHYNSSKKQIINALKLSHRRQMPLIDNNKKLIDVFTLDDIEFNSKPNNVVIMAGGLGTRLGSLTKDTPKPMLRVGEKPILENLINIFSEQGFTNFYISVNYKSEIIKEYFGDGSNLGVKIIYIEETKRMGTAGSLALIEETINEPFFLINGDILTTLDFNDLLISHTSYNSIATMCIRKYNYQIPYGVIHSNNNIISSIEEKPSYNFFINTGIYVFNPEILKFVPKDIFFDMTELFTNLVEENIQTTSYEIDDYWIDIGHISDYEKVLNDFKV